MSIVKRFELPRVNGQLIKLSTDAGDDVIHGGSGSIGIKSTNRLVVEVNAEGGNFAAGPTFGFNYFIIGPRIIYRF